jgi:hypothetical protein
LRCAICTVVIALSAIRVPDIAFIDRNSAGIFVVAILFFLYLAVVGTPVPDTNGASAIAQNI